MLINIIIYSIVGIVCGISYTITNYLNNYNYRFPNLKKYILCAIPVTISQITFLILNDYLKN